jgi:primosomal protein N' (replication factor Y)
LARVVFSHKNAQTAKKELDRYVARFINQKNLEVIGFGECNIFKIANKYRYELLLRSSDIKTILGFLHSIDSPCASIDMDSLY